MIIWKYGNKLQILLLMFLDIFVAAQMVFLALMLSEFIAAGTAGDMDRFLRVALIAVGGFTLISVINWVHATVRNLVVQTVNLRIKTIMTTQIVDRDPLPDNNGTTISFMTNDLKLLETNGVMSELDLLEDGLTAIFAIAGGIWFDWLTTLVFVAGSLFPVLISGAAQKPIDKSSEAWTKQNAHYTSWLKDILSGLDTVRTYQANAIAKERMTAASSELEGSLKKMDTLVDHIQVAMQYLGLTIGLLLPFGVGIARIITGALTVAGFIGVVQLSNSITNPLLDGLGAINKRNTTRQILKRIDKAAAAQADQRAAQELGIFHDLKLAGVQLTRGEKTIVSDLNLAIERGQHILLKAPSGFGKTTILYALQGEVPLANGNYLINDQNMLTMPQTQLIQNFSLIKQTPFMFADTLRFNLTLGGQFADAEINTAAKRAHLDALVAEKGWDYQVGESGHNLSGGQIQRVEIARAFLHQRPVLLADEATSALGEKLADEIHQEFFAPGQTVIEVAHHISPEWEAKFDQVITLG
ncbi:ATP-binding cassette domain-containing protein [Lapidilactobacillus mulanensis]|uniref:ATP-binding cassette domain-containing protein n=1 Tax=Lapidilactobacillus mulanensis TaxID=2485999 RepID=A0ABW4DMD9_9LACO|nr:ABC transporter ATP-binding protein [Lapidilactobacillus mulanensis]